MALNSLEIKSFKSIVSQRLELGQINVFIGPNGSGKSNLLEAVGFLSAALAGKMSYGELAERGVRLSAPAVFKTSFRDVEEKDTLSLRADIGDTHYRVNVGPKSKGQIEYAGEEIKTPRAIGSRGTGQKVSFESKRDSGESRNGLYEDIVLDSAEGLVPLAERFKLLGDQKGIRNLVKYAIFSPSTQILRGISPDCSYKDPMGLHGGSLAVALHDVMEESRAGRSDIERFFRFLEWFESVATTDEKSSKLQSSHIHTASRVVVYQDRFMKDTLNKLCAYDVSEGALYILFVLVLLLHEDAPKIFALDNVGNALHPTLARELMQRITEIVGEDRNRQLFIATHNPTSLDAIDLFNESQRLFVVDRNDYGYTEIKRIPPPRGFTKQQWVEKHGRMRLSEMWMAGLIGGLANPLYRSRPHPAQDSNTLNSISEAQRVE